MPARVPRVSRRSSGHRRRTAVSAAAASDAVLLRSAANLFGDVDAHGTPQRCTARIRRSRNCRTGRARYRSLWVSHCRYRLLAEARTGRRGCRRSPGRSTMPSAATAPHGRRRGRRCPPRRCRSRSGRRGAQLPQLRQLDATSSQRAASWLAASSARRPGCGMDRPIRCAAPATASRAPLIVASSATACGTLAITPAPACVPDLHQERMPFTCDEFGQRQVVAGALLPARCPWMRRSRSRRARYSSPPRSARRRGGPRSASCRARCRAPGPGCRSPEGHTAARRRTPAGTVPRHRPRPRSRRWPG